MRTATVITTIRQEIELPDDADKQDVLNFLAAYQDFSTFLGVDDEAGHRITSVQVIEDEIESIDDAEDDDIYANTATGTLHLG